MIDRRRFLQTGLAGGIASVSGHGFAADASSVTPARSFQTGPTPAPAFSYPAGDPSILVLHPSKREIEHEGRQGLTFTSIRGRAALPRHTVAGRKGSLSCWILPLQEIAPAPQYPSHAISNPFYKNFVFLTDREAVDDTGAASFCLFTTSDWYPGLTAKFTNRQVTGSHWGDPRAQAAAGHFEFLPHNWYQLVVTWDRDRGDYRIYANGILVGTSDVFNKTPSPDDVPSATMFFGNPSYAMGQVDFFDRILTPTEIESFFVKNGGRTDTEIQQSMEALYTGNRLPAFIPPGMEGNGWIPRKKLSLMDPVQNDKEFFLQGTGPCLHYSPEGLRITTPGLQEYLQERGKTEYDTTRMYLWTRDVFEGDLYVTAEFKLHRHRGLALWMVQAAGMQGEDFLNDYPLRSDGSMNVVCWEDVRNYHWEFYREMFDTRNDLVSHLVAKNPWLWPLAFQVENRHWELDRWYRVSFLQEKNRLRGAIDNVTVFDVTDNGLTNTGPVMRQGRVALRLMMRSDITFRNLEISNRPNFV